MWRHLRSNYAIIFKVEPPQPVVYSMPMNFLHIVNSYANIRDNRHIEWEELINAFPLLKDEMKPPTEGETKSQRLSIASALSLSICFGNFWSGRIPFTELVPNSLRSESLNIPVGFARNISNFSYKAMISFGSSLQDIRERYTLDGSHLHMGRPERLVSSQGSF